jgi:DNA-binding FadR family transcriptional regulator
MDIKEETFKSLKRNRVVDDIIEAIKQALIRGDLTPGQRLPSENELAQRLGVGRGAIREAMKMLSALGVVEIKQGNGTYITSEPSPMLLTPLSFVILLQMGMTDELFELRSLFQVGYCQLAARKATREEMERIAKTLEDWSIFAHEPARDIDQLVQLDLNFHFAILTATHNPFIIKIGHAIEELFYASMRTTISDGIGLELGIEGHKNILQALYSRDPEKIRLSVEESLKNWERGLKKLYP